MTDLPVEMLEAAAQALIAFDGEHPSAPWEFYAEAALEAAGVLALLEERDRLRAVLREILDSGVEFDDERIKWVSMQVNRVDIEEAHAALRGGSE